MPNVRVLWQSLCCTFVYYILFVDNNEGNCSVPVSTYKLPSSSVQSWYIWLVCTVSRQYKRYHSLISLTCLCYQTCNFKPVNYCSFKIFCFSFSFFREIDYFLFGLVQRMKTFYCTVHPVPWFYLRYWHSINYFLTYIKQLKTAIALLAVISKQATQNTNRRTIHFRHCCFASY